MHSHKSKKWSGHEIYNRLAWFSTEKDKMHLYSTHVITELEHEPNRLLGPLCHH